MFKKNNKKKIDLADLEGVVTFFGSHHALKGESVLKKNKIPVKLIPGPRDISPNCGTAIRFDYNYKDVLMGILKDCSVLYEGIHHYPVNQEKR